MGYGKQAFAIFSNKRLNEDNRLLPMNVIVNKHWINVDMYQNNEWFDSKS